MIINSIADGQVTSTDLVQFNFRDIAYVITGTSRSLSGTVLAGQYENVDATVTGSGPYKVTLGYVNQSYQAAPVSVDSNESLVTFWMAFPAGPNGPTAFVFSNQASSTSKGAGKAL